MYQRELFIYIGYLFYNYINSKINYLINEANWNILVASGKEIKRDCMNSVNENKIAY